MKKFKLSILLLLTGFCFSQEPVVFYNALDFTLQGTAYYSDTKENPFHRLPTVEKEKVREKVWNLSTNSAGISIDFKTNSSFIKVKWEVINNFNMNHMTGTGIRGLDLYCKNRGKWQYVGSGKPIEKITERTLIKDMSKKMKEFRIYLPLYDGIESLEIGIDSTAKIEKSDKFTGKPIVFYGTSITQGGCASRPGMAYTNIISRTLDKECINLGFSGNGWLQEPLANILAGIDAEMIIIDCLPNMTIKMVHENIPPAIDIIRKANPDVPIVLVESVLFESAYFNPVQYQELYDKNGALVYEFNKLMENNYRKIYLIRGKDLTGNDHEGTVDGVHFTDLGFSRFADNLIERMKKQGLID